MPLPMPSLLGIVVYIDTHLVDAADEQAISLRRLDSEGWLRVNVTDVVDTELMHAPENRRASLLEAAGRFSESYGPAVLDVSRLNASVVGGPQDTARLRQVYRLLFPGADRATATQNHLRDAMHVSTAIRYGGYAFITREKRLLNKHAVIADAFGGFRIWSVEQVLREAASRISGRRELHRRECRRGPLPAWPGEDVLSQWR